MHKPVIDAIDVVNIIALRQVIYVIVTWHLFFVSDNETFEGRSHCIRIWFHHWYNVTELHGILKYDQTELFSSRLSLASPYT